MRACEPLPTAHPEFRCPDIGAELNEANSVFALFHSWWFPSRPANSGSLRLSQRRGTRAWEHVAERACGRGGNRLTPSQAHAASADVALRQLQRIPSATEGALSPRPETEATAESLASGDLAAQAPSVPAAGLGPRCQDPDGEGTGAVNRLVFEAGQAEFGHNKETSSPPLEPVTPACATGKVPQEPRTSCWDLRPCGAQQSADRGRQADVAQQLAGTRSPVEPSSALVPLPLMPPVPEQGAIERCSGSAERGQAGFLEDRDGNAGAGGGRSSIRARQYASAGGSLPLAHPPFASIPYNQLLQLDYPHVDPGHECLIRRQEAELRALRQRCEQLQAANRTLVSQLQHPSLTSSNFAEADGGGSIDVAAKVALRGVTADGGILTEGIASPQASERTGYNEQPWLAQSWAHRRAAEVLGGTRLARVATEGGGRVRSSALAPSGSVAPAVRRSIGACMPPQPKNALPWLVHSRPGLVASPGPSARASIDSICSSPWALSPGGYVRYGRGTSGGGGTPSAAIRFHTNPLSRRGAGSAGGNSSQLQESGSGSLMSSLNSPASSSSYAGVSYMAYKPYGYGRPPQSQQQFQQHQQQFVAASGGAVLQTGLSVTPVALRTMLFGAGMTLHDNPAAVAAASDSGGSLGGGAGRASTLVEMRTNPLALDVYDE